MPTTSLFSPGVSELPTALERNGGSEPQWRIVSRVVEFQF